MTVILIGFGLLYIFAGLRIFSDNLALMLHEVLPQREKVSREGRMVRGELTSTNSPI